MVKKIVYTNGGDVVTNFIDTRQSDQVYINRFVSRGFPDAVVIDSSNFPDSNYRDAWELSGSTITVDMTNAKEIHRDKLRSERETCFEICDKLFLEAFSQGKDLTTIKARQQYLRDLPSDPAIDAATTTTELSAVTVADWTPPVVKDLPAA